jgi:hypothetical protein
MAARDKTTPGSHYFSDEAVELLFAEQLATDVAAVTAKKSKIQEGTTILGVSGTLPVEGGGTVRVLGIKPKAE